MTDPSDFERLKFARENSMAEVMHRRERQWKVFSWVSSLYLAIIGGVIAISGSDLTITTWHKRFLIAAVLLFALLGFFRLIHDARVAKAHSDKCFELDGRLNVAFDDSNDKLPKMRWAHAAFLWPLAILTIGVIWAAPT
jgi:hypothetical protein